MTVLLFCILWVILMVALQRAFGLSEWVVLIGLLIGLLVILGVL